MKKVTLCMFLVVSCSFAQDTLFKHVYWQAFGGHSLEYFGFNGLDTIGYVNDTIQHALSIGEDAGAAFVLNRKPLDSLHPDTAPVYQFPTANVLPANFNGDPYKDFVCWDANGNVTVLLGTAQINKFDTAFVLHFGKGVLSPAFNFVEHEVLVCDCDSDGYDDLMIAAYGLAKIYVYKGSATMDSLPSDSVATGAQEIAVGYVKNATQLYLAQTYWSFSRYYSDTVSVLLYPLRKNIQLHATDTIRCRMDSGGTFTGGFALTDVNGDGIDDILLGGSLGNVSVYYGGVNISPYPTFIFHRPFDTQSSAFGSKIVDVGDVTGNGYHSLFIADPQAGGGESGGGAVFLYNIGKALKDTCVAFGELQPFLFAQFGTQAIGIGDNLGNGHTGFAASDQLGNPFPADGNGQVYAFLGSSSYGPMVGVRGDGSIPIVFNLGQNYPNPVSGETTIMFSVLDPRLYGSEAIVTLYNSLGTKVATIYRGKADNYSYTLGFDASALPAGNYYYRLECGGREETRMMSIMR